MKRSRKIETVCSVSSNGGSLFLFLLIQRTTSATPVVNFPFLICQTQCATEHVRFKKNWTVCELSTAYIYIHTIVMLSLHLRGSQLGLGQESRLHTRLSPCWSGRSICAVEVQGKCIYLQLPAITAFMHVSCRTRMHKLGCTSSPEGLNLFYHLSHLCFWEEQGGLVELARADSEQTLAGHSVSTAVP